MRAREVAAGQLFDLAHPVAQRMAVAEDLAGGLLPLAVLLDEGLQRAQQLAAVLLVARLDRAEHAVAVEAERVVVLAREQQGEGAAGGPLAKAVASSAQRASWKEWRRVSGAAVRLAAARTGPWSTARAMRAAA